MMETYQQSLARKTILLWNNKIKQPIKPFIRQETEIEHFSLTLASIFNILLASALLDTKEGTNQ